MSAADPVLARPPLGFPTRLAYAVGATANSVKLRGLSTFLLIFYAGRPSAGPPPSANNLFKKIVSGVGIVISTAILRAIDFPIDAAPTGLSSARS